MTPGWSRKVTDFYGSRRDGAVLAKFIDDLADKLFFTVITVTNDTFQDASMTSIARSTHSNTSCRRAPTTTGRSSLRRKQRNRSYRLGNLTILEAGPNRDSGNLAFAHKKAVYAASGFELTRRVASEK
jgi:hypothetical protein